MAASQGFEPWVPIGNAGLANQCLKPLSQLAIFLTIMHFIPYESKLYRLTSFYIYSFHRNTHSTYYFFHHITLSEE